MYRVCLIALICAIVPLQAGILWDQQPDVSVGGFVDQEFADTGYTGYSTYQVHDVTVGAGGWNIQSITGYYTSGWGTWPASADVRINIFSKTGALPGAGDDPTAGLVYSATLTSDGSVTSVTASGLDIDLAPGSYWIGITPILAFSVYGQEFHAQVSGLILGDPSAIRNQAGGFGFGTDWGTYELLLYPAGDGALRIEGTGGIPEPATWSLLALGAGAFALLRRRK